MKFFLNFSFILAIAMLRPLYAYALDIQDPITEKDYYFICKDPKNSDAKAYCVAIAYGIFVIQVYDDRESAPGFCKSKYYEEKIKSGELTPETIYDKTIKVLEKYNSYSKYDPKSIEKLNLSSLEDHINEAFPFPHEECDDYYEN